MELLEELEACGISNAKAYVLIADAIVIGVEAAVYRKETASKIADLQVERQQRNASRQYRQHLGQ